MTFCLPRVLKKVVPWTYRFYYFLYGSYDLAFKKCIPLIHVSTYHETNIITCGPVFFGGWSQFMEKNLLQYFIICIGMGLLKYLFKILPSFPATRHQLCCICPFLAKSARFLIYLNMSSFELQLWGRGMILKGHSLRPCYFYSYLINGGSLQSCKDNATWRKWWKKKMRLCNPFTPLNPPSKKLPLCTLTLNY